MVGGSGQIGSALMVGARAAGRLAVGTSYSQKHADLLQLNI